MTSRTWEGHVDAWLSAVMCSQLHSSAKVTGYGLSRYADWETGRNCWPSRSTLAETLHLSEATVKRSLAQIEAAGFIVRTGVTRPKNATDYALAIPTQQLRDGRYRLRVAVWSPSPDPGLVPGSGGFVRASRSSIS